MMKTLSSWICIQILPEVASYKNIEETDVPFPISAGSIPEENHCPWWMTLLGGITISFGCLSTILAGELWVSPMSLWVWRPLPLPMWDDPPLKHQLQVQIKDYINDYQDLGDVYVIRTSSDIYQLTPDI